MSDAPLIRHLGLAPYEPTWRAMQRVYRRARELRRPMKSGSSNIRRYSRLGLNASREHLLAPGDIPVVQIDRGGQVTYHGPGQLVVYPLIDLRRRALGRARTGGGARECRHRLCGRTRDRGARARAQAPGVYVDGAKLASVGLRIRRGASYHGMALNVSLDLEPFERINVCGHRGTCGHAARGSVRARRSAAHVGAVRGGDGLTPHLLRQLGDSARDYSAINTDLQAVNSR